MQKETPYGEKVQAEIDIIGEQDKNTALFAECKWTNEKVDLGVLEILEVTRIWQMRWEM